MSKRRTRGTGSIQRLTSGNWRARINKGVINGKRDVESKVFPTEEEARTWLAVMTAERVQGRLPATSRETVADYLEGWLRIKEKAVRPVTYASYRDTLRKHVIPALGALRLQKGLTVSALQSYIGAKHQDGLSARTIRYHISILGMALADAVPDLIPHNPCTDRRVRKVLPKRERADIHPLDEEEVHLFRGAVRRWVSLPPQGKSKHVAQSLSEAQRAYRQTVADLFEVALDTWMRQGELLGLRVQDVDLPRHRVLVRKALARVGGLMNPKNEGSRRAIDLISDESVEALGRQCADKPSDALVFAGVDPRHLLRNLGQVLRLARLRHVRFHDLRHTGISLALIKGAPVKDVSARAGHASAKMTLDVYAHLLSGSGQRISDVLGPVLNGKEPVEAAAR